MDNRRALPPPRDDFTRALLRSAEVDEPSSAAYAKVATVLGVGTAIGVGASLSAPVELGVGVSSAAGGYGSLVSKLAWLGLSGALLAGAAGAYLRHRATDRTSAAHVVLAAHLPVRAAFLAALPEPPALAPPAACGPTSDAASVVLKATPPTSRPNRSPRSLRAGAPLPRGSSLPEQVQSLDRARVALGSGDARGALLEIAYYRHVWPEGVFLTEASVLEIEALAKRGDPGLAAERAEAFVAAHPDSPRAERLRALIAAARR